MQGPANPNRSERVAQIERIVEARATGDIGLLDSVFSPNVSLRLAGRRPHAPFAGTYVGLPAVREALSTMWVDFEYLDVDTGHMLIDDDKAGVHWFGTLRNRGTSKRSEFEGFMLFTFEDDLVVECVAFIDTAGLHHMLSED